MIILNAALKLRCLELQKWMNRRTGREKSCYQHRASSNGNPYQELFSVDVVTAAIWRWKNDDLAERRTTKHFKLINYMPITWIRICCYPMLHIFSFLAEICCVVNNVLSIRKVQWYCWRSLRLLFPRMSRLWFVSPFACRWSLSLSKYLHF